MIIHCTKCHHEWEASIWEICYSCGTKDPEDHVEGCAIMLCDWCDAPGKVIDTRTQGLPSIEEVMQELADMHQKRKEKTNVEE